VSLYNGLDITAIATLGVYTETYDSATGAANIANLYISYGFLEDAPAPVEGGFLNSLFGWFWEFF